MFSNLEKKNPVNEKSNQDDYANLHNDIFHSILKNTTWNVSSSILMLLLQLITTPYIVHKLGDAQFGIWSLANILITYFFFLDIGISTACTKFLSEKFTPAFSEEINNIFWTALFITLILGIIASGCMYALAPFLIKHFFSISKQLLPIAVTVISICSFSLFFTFIVGIIKTIPFALKRFDLINKIQLLTSSILVIGTVLILYVGGNLIQIAILSLLTQFLSVILFSIASHKIAPEINFSGMKIDSLTKLLKYGRFVLISNIISPILMHLEKLLIAMLASTTMITYYIVPHNLLTRLWLISSGFATALFPTLSQITGSENLSLVSSVINKSIKFISSVSAFILIWLFVFADSFLKIWMGNNFAMLSTNVMRILCFGFWLNLIAQIISTFFRASNRPQIPAIFHIIEVLIYIPIAYWLIAKYNLEGAAYAWLIRIVADALMLIIAYQIIIKIKAYALFKAIFNEATISVCITGAILLFIKIHNLIPASTLAILSIILAIISFLQIWYKIFTDKEHKLIINLIPFLRNRN